MHGISLFQQIGGPLALLAAGWWLTETDELVK